MESLEQHQGRRKQQQACRSEDQIWISGQCWAQKVTLHRMTTHSDANCHAQGAPRTQTSSRTAAAVGVHTLTDDTENKPVVDFDHDFDKGFTF